MFDATVNIAGRVFKNPIWTASGTFAYGMEFEPFLDLNRLGAIIVKGLSVEPRAGNAPHRIYETPSGMLNSIGLQNVGMVNFVEEKLPQLRKFRSQVIANIFGRTGRTYDISVLGQTEPDGSPAEDLILEAALFSSGHPVLVVPYIQRAPVKLDRVLLCWDNSRNAARAFADALPLLKRAKVIDVVTIATSEKRNELPGADIAHHLARHGLKVELKRIVAPDTDVPNTILSYVADSSADLVVMGGYGHSRLREFVLGGATRGMLSAMTVPTLMSH